LQIERERQRPALKAPVQEIIVASDRAPVGKPREEGGMYGSKSVYQASNRRRALQQQLRSMNLELHHVNRALKQPRSIDPASDFVAHREKLHLASAPCDQAGIDGRLYLLFCRVISMSANAERKRSFIAAAAVGHCPQRLLTP
jgi:hypothetical protein